MDNRPLRSLQLRDIPLPTNITITSFPQNNNDPSTPSSTSSSSSSSSLQSPSSSSSSTSSAIQSSSAPSTFNPAVDALSIGAFTATFSNANTTTVTNYNTPDRHAQQQSSSASLFMHSPASSSPIRYPPALSSRPSFLNMLSPSLSPSSILNSVSNLNLNIPGVDLNAVDRDISSLNLSNDTQMQSLLENHLTISTPQNSSNSNNNISNSDAQPSYTPSSSSLSSSSLSSSSSTPSASATTPSSSTSPQSPQNKLALFFLHPVPNSNLLTVMKCLQPFPQDILIDSRDISPFLPLIGCFYICTMEEKEVLSIFPMSKPIMRWGVYHKGTRQLLFSSFYRFNCAFGAKGFFTYH